jgi:molybdate transport system regulatory protein
MPRTVLIPQFAIEGEGVSRVGADRIALLEAVRDRGSISAAGRALGLSYKAAWDGVSALNNLFPQPLVTAQPGGRHGGGARLTVEGAEVIASFRALEEELARMMADLRERLAEKGVPRASRLLRSLAMRTSARNALSGVVETVTPGAVNAEVVLRLTDGVHLTAVITGRSVADLGLAPGVEATALVKSSFVILAPAGEVGRISARNRLEGTVVAREDGAVNSEIVLDLGGGKTLAAVVTKESAEDLGLRPGSRACALIKASHVILAVA